MEQGDVHKLFSMGEIICERDGKDKIGGSSKCHSEVIPALI